MSFKELRNANREMQFKRDPCWDQTVKLPRIPGMTLPSQEAHGGKTNGAMANGKLGVALAGATGGAPSFGSAYASFLQRAGLADLSDLEAMQLFYRAGCDLPSLMADELAAAPGRRRPCHRRRHP